MSRPTIVTLALVFRLKLLVRIAEVEAAAIRARVNVKRTTITANRIERTRKLSESLHRDLTRWVSHLPTLRSDGRVIHSKSSGAKVKNGIRQYVNRESNADHNDLR